MKEVICPKCKSNDVVMERPFHGQLEKPSVQFNCYCPKCDLGFIAHCTISFVKATDLQDFTEEENKDSVRY